MWEGLLDCTRAQHFSAGVCGGLSLLYVLAVCLQLERHAISGHGVQHDSLLAGLVTILQ